MSVLTQGMGMGGAVPPPPPPVIDAEIYLAITGQLEDGSAPRTHFNPHTALHVTQGADVLVTLRVFTPAGEQVILNSGTVVELTVKKRAADQTPVFHQVGTIASGTATFRFLPADTRTLTPGLFCWDVWLTCNGIRSPVIPFSTFHLEPTATSIP